jgi:RNA polymerase sigma-70 factor (ECF subfamily)
VTGDRVVKVEEDRMEARIADPDAGATAMVQRLRLVFDRRAAAPPAKPTFFAKEAEVASGRVGYLSDSDLIALVAAGNEQTVAELADRYGHKAHELALRIVREPGVAEHVVKAAIYAVWREGRQRVAPLQLAAAILASVHRKSVEKVLEPAGGNSGLLPPDEPPARSGAWELEHEPVHRALVQLPDEERELIMLAYYAGLRASELTDVRVMRDGTTTRRIEVGLSRLAAALASAREELTSDTPLQYSRPLPAAPTGRRREPVRLLPVILVCDPEPVHRDLIRASLEQGSCDVLEVDDWHRLQPSIDALEPDLLIVDPYAPGVDEFGVLLLTCLSPNRARVPVLALTAAVTRQQREAALAAGADCFMPKPFSPRELASTVAQLLAARLAPEQPASTGLASEPGNSCPEW